MLSSDTQWLWDDFFRALRGPTLSAFPMFAQELSPYKDSIRDRP
jgi:hypothetical protein